MVVPFLWEGKFQWQEDYFRNSGSLGAIYIQNCWAQTSPDGAQDEPLKESLYGTTHTGFLTSPSHLDLASLKDWTQSVSSLGQGNKCLNLILFSLFHLPNYPSSCMT